jgi:hypothetical protein
MMARGHGDGVMRVLEISARSWVSLACREVIPRETLEAALVLIRQCREKDMEGFPVIALGN